MTCRESGPLIDPAGGYAVARNLNWANGHVAPEALSKWQAISHHGARMSLNPCLRCGEPGTPESVAALAAIPLMDLKAWHEAWKAENLPQAGGR